MFLKLIFVSNISLPAQNNDMTGKTKQNLGRIILGEMFPSLFCLLSETV
ncbi:MAG: hypothetical protein LBP87_01195 [Planctomycetaceae bacterium]|nr:hypothetical protein [Planctomycetaceae bacterium]